MQKVMREKIADYQQFAFSENLSAIGG